MLKTTLKQKLPNIYKNPILLTKWNKTNIQVPSKLRQYRTSLHNKLKNTPDTNNINEEWERIKEAITDAVNEVIQIQSRPPRNEWWDEECRQHIKKKNKARSKWLQQNITASQEAHKKMRIEANVLIRRKKRHG